MARNAKQMETTPIPEPANNKAEIYYKSNDEEECLKVKNLTLSNILELKRMFNAYKLVIEKENI